MLVKKPTSSARTCAKVIPIGYGSQLQSLYARRTAVEELIQSLEDYQRFRAQRTFQLQSKSA
ncbi:MAG: hypothetical protein WDO73_26950 [Ignavibacteriota bacterium]